MDGIGAAIAALAASATAATTTTAVVATAEAGAAVGAGAAATATAAGLIVPMTTASGALLTTLPAASTTLATLGTYASLASAGLGGLSAIRAGDTQAAIGRNNAEIGKINAGAAMNAGEAEAARIQSQTRRKLATGENAFADSGIQTGQGSALDVMGDMAAEGALDTQIARWRGTSAANSAIMQGQQQRVQAGASQTAGYTGAGTTLLTGATTIANQRTYAKAMGLSNGGLFS